MEGNKPFTFGMSDNALNFSVDPNKDGQPFLKGNVYLSEGFQEIFQRDGSLKIEGAKVVDFELSPLGLRLVLDTDQDGQKVLDLDLDFTESADEVKSLLSKKDSEPA